MTSDKNQKADDSSDLGAVASKTADRLAPLAVGVKSWDLIAAAFVEGAVWQAEEAHVSEPDTLKAAAKRIAELEDESQALKATVDSLDRQIEARSGKTAAERLLCERADKAEARVKELEAELAAEAAVKMDSEHYEQENLRLRTERDEFWSRAERAEAKLDKVRAHIDSKKHYTIFGWDVPVSALLAILDGEDDDK